MKTKTLLLVIVTFCSINLLSQNIHTLGYRLAVQVSQDKSIESQSGHLYGVSEVGQDEVLKTDCLIAYAYVAYDPTGGITEGPCLFDLYDPGMTTSLAPGSAGDFIAAGTWAKGKWYGEEWGVGNLYEINPFDGSMTFIGSCGQNIAGLAWDGETMYACTGNQLFHIDLDDGAASFIGTMGNTQFMVGMGCDSAGNIYGVDIYDDNLYSINKTTGAATVIGPLGIDLDEYAQDMDFDKDNDVLYLSGLVNGMGGLYTINTSTGAATLVGEFMNGVEIDAFAIPYGGSIISNDIGIVSILSPTSGTILTDEEPVIVLLKNFGTNAQSNFEVSFTVGGGSPVTETITETINGCETYEYTFTATADLSAIAIHIVEICTGLAGDEIPANNCMTEHVFNFPTDIDENSLFNIQVYPNPASAFVEIKSDLVLRSVEIFNPTGQLVFYIELNSKSYHLNTSNFVSGVYNFRIKTDEGNVSRRIIIN